jgi:hypothetical protein
VLALADKATNIVFACQKKKILNYGCRLNELGFTSTCGISTDTRTNLTKDENLQNHLSVLNTLNIPKKKNINLNYATFVGFQNCIKLLTNKDTLFVPVSTPLGLYIYHILIC